MTCASCIALVDGDFEVFDSTIILEYIEERWPEPALLPALTRRVDEVFTAGRPRYLWRLGPEFGVDKNVRHLVERHARDRQQLVPAATRAVFTHLDQLHVAAVGLKNTTTGDTLCE